MDVRTPHLRAIPTLDGQAWRVQWLVSVEAGAEDWDTYLPRVGLHVAAREINTGRVWTRKARLVRERFIPA